MSNVPNVNSSSNSQYSSNPAINSNSDTNVSAFLILAEAMSKSIDNAGKSLDSQTLEQKEKQAILQELQGITDLEQKKSVIAFLLKTLGSSDSSIKAWLTGLKDQNQDTIDKIWKMLYGYYQSATGSTVTDGGSPLFSQIDKDDERAKKGYALFLGDAELNPQLSKQRLALIENIKQLMQNPDEAASNFTQLASDFQGLQTIVQEEQKIPNDLAIPAKWVGKQASKLETAIKGICKGKYNFLADIGMPGMALIDGLYLRLDQLILGIPSDIIGGFQKTIIKDTSALATQGLIDLQSAESANSIMNGQYVIDSQTVGARIQKGTEALNKYNNLLEKSLPNDSKLISSINYSNKV
ncbi:MAG: hypothetical protein K940chlam4_01184 [Candidatus Anoxychlamydiales bacterium]|nr:hypothetical protein [Candidatus Anoxychlamydiales bacterium]